MLRQYYEIKNDHPGCILLFRLGDFYEMFDDDAVWHCGYWRSRSLPRGRKGPANPHVRRALPLGGGVHRPALGCRVQSGSLRAGGRPKEAKGVVRREVVRIFTPGTLVELGMLQERENNFLVAVTRKDGPGSRKRAGRPASGEGEPSSTQERLLPVTGGVYGVAACDLSTGEFLCTQIEGEDAFSVLTDEIAAPFAVGAAPRSRHGRSRL